MPLASTRSVMFIHDVSCTTPSSMTLIRPTRSVTNSRSSPGAVTTMVGCCRPVAIDSMASALSGSSGSTTSRSPAVVAMVAWVVLAVVPSAASVLAVVSPVPRRIGCGHAFGERDLGDVVTRAGGRFTVVGAGKRDEVQRSEQQHPDHGAEEGTDSAKRVGELVVG